jgi:N-acetylmuramoyl-L-alanine amidase
MNPPGGLTAARDGGGDVLSWQPVGLASGYEVWRDGAFVAMAPTTTFTDVSPGPGRHHYDVRAVLQLGALRVEESPPASVEIGGGTVVIDPGHGGEDSGAVGDV